MFGILAASDHPDWVLVSTGWFPWFEPPWVDKDPKFPSQLLATSPLIWLCRLVDVEAFTLAWKEEKEWRYKREPKFYDLSFTNKSFSWPDNQGFAVLTLKKWPEMGILASAR